MQGQHGVLLALFVIGGSVLDCSGSQLYPRESESREVKLLDGVWKFRVCTQEDQDAGFREKWFARPLEKSGSVIPMPVPASFNDITQNATLRDYVGWAWYQTEFFAPRGWWNGKSRVFLRFGSVHYVALVYLDNKLVAKHVGGHLPFGAEVTKALIYGGKNRVTVAVSNTLTKSTIPQGSVFKPQDAERYPPGYQKQNVPFDFFNYAGIHRSVALFTTPKHYIRDITLVTTKVSNSSASVKYDIDVLPPDPKVNCRLTLLDDQGWPVLVRQGCSGTFGVTNPKLWWPQGMHRVPGYQYMAKVEATLDGVTDVYYQKFGLRTVRATETQLLLNERPLYLTGFGMHEDADIRGRGLDLALVVKDFNLIRWIGANSFRTSHYPYSEELMDQADAQGIAVIDESPAVAQGSFDSALLSAHKERMTELVQRDKNRPSVIMWSVVNEPQSAQPQADRYFGELVAHVKTLDPTRPVTAALSGHYNKDLAGQYMDVIMHNKYAAWYTNPGSLQVIERQTISEYEAMHGHYRKPIMISEYGADAVTGLHADPAFVFTEDFQAQLLFHHHKAFDQLRSKGYFVGEHVWNFADFMTDQDPRRAFGNRKGIFTRNRQPKAAAKVLRCRYHKLSGRTIGDFDAYCPPS
ncbi:beta-glucuronidase isoform X1 [Ixodes scapularis]|uniref:beta-glucuronidase isoform X1 n=1 Tax=Ixodes scapularis TaxID=6945 RepID=UPI001A9E1E4A|nr:beta-glucuronidase isoform X1 [Ixodes scapularis]